VRELFAQTECLDERLIASFALALEVGEQLAALANHHEEAATAVLVLFVRFEMVCQGSDALREDSDLHFWTTRVLAVTTVIAEDFFLSVACNTHELWGLMRANPRWGRREASRSKRVPN